MIANFREGGFGGRDRRSGGFSRGGSGGSRGGFGGGRSFNGHRSSGPREMHDATCSKCGKECQVPFRPTGEKPVLCSECFGGRDLRNGNNSRPFQPRSQPAGDSKQMEQINAKLDKIIAILSDLELEVPAEDEEVIDEDATEDNEENTHEITITPVQAEDEEDY